jgi:hypothetical protein
MCGCLRTPGRAQSCPALLGRDGRAVYGGVRVLVDFIPQNPAWWGGTLVAVGVLTAVTGVLYTVAETQFKRVLAYSTIENMGLVFVSLGFALLMRGYGYQSLAGLGLVVALLHTLNHAVFKALLFLVAGAVVQATRASSLEAYGGLISRMPQTAVFGLVGAVALAALPPLNGFTSEWLTFQLLVAGARHTAPELAILLPLALAGVALVAGSRPCRPSDVRHRVPRAASIGGGVAWRPAPCGATRCPRRGVALGRSSVRARPPGRWRPARLPGRAQWGWGYGAVFRRPLLTAASPRAARPILALRRRRCGPHVGDLNAAAP